MSIFSNFLWCYNLIMILHIIYNDKFTIDYINFFNSNFSQYDNQFIIYGFRKDRDYTKYNNVTRINNIIQINKMIHSLRLMSKAEKIIVTGCFGIEQLLFPLPKKIWNKIYMQFWGGDYMRFKNVESSASKSVFKKCLIKSKKLLVLTPFEYDEIKNIFNIEKRYDVTPVPSNISLDLYKKIRLETSKHDYVNILLGNSATVENNHISTLNVLSKYKNDNIKIYCPLSYGNKEYGNKVIQYGKQIFGDKFIPLVDFMPYDEYAKLLNNCDVALFNMERQQALGNIFIMFALGKKVFLNKNNPAHKYFSSINVKTFLIGDINSLSLEQFVSYSEDNIKNNLEYIDGYQDYEIKTWKNLLDSD